MEWTEANANNPGSKTIMMYVQDIMSKEVLSMSEDESIAKARTIMGVARIRHVPVVDKEDGFVGLITHRDILAVTVSRLAGISAEMQADLDEGIKARDIMNCDACTVAPDTGLKDAAQILLRHKYGCLPVLDGRRLVGMLTEADFLRLTIHLLDAVDEAL